MTNLFDILTDTQIAKAMRRLSDADLAAVGRRVTSPGITLATIPLPRPASTEKFGAQRHTGPRRIRNVTYDVRQALAGGPLSGADVARAIGVNSTQVHFRLAALLRYGKVRRVSRGTYELTAKGRAGL